MKKKLLICLVLCCLMSCKKHHDSQPDPVTTVAGSIYGSQFVYKSAKEQYTNFSYGSYKPEDLFTIYLSANAGDNCDSPDSNFLVRLSAPRKVGKFSKDVYVLVKDPNSGASSLFSTADASIEIEITAVTADKITGRIAINSVPDQTVLNGSFECVICQ